MARARGSGRPGMIRVNNTETLSDLQRRAECCAVLSRQVPGNTEPRMSDAGRHPASRASRGGGTVESVSPAPAENFSHNPGPIPEGINFEEATERHRSSAGKLKCNFHWARPPGHRRRPWLVPTIRVNNEGANFEEATKRHPCRQNAFSPTNFHSFLALPALLQVIFLV